MKKPDFKIDEEAILHRLSPGEENSIVGRANVVTTSIVSSCSHSVCECLLAGCGCPVHKSCPPFTSCGLAGVGNEPA